MLRGLSLRTVMFVLDGREVSLAVTVNDGITHATDVRRNHRHCCRQTLPMRGSVDHDTDLKPAADFDSSQTESPPQHAPNVTVGAKRFRYAEVLQPAYQSNMKCVVYIRKELCTMSCCHVARPCSK